MACLFVGGVGGERAWAAAQGGGGDGGGGVGACPAR